MRSLLRPSPGKDCRSEPKEGWEMGQAMLGRGSNQLVSQGMPAKIPEHMGAEVIQRGARNGMGGHKWEEGGINRRSHLRVCGQRPHAEGEGIGTREKLLKVSPQQAGRCHRLPLQL